uniref:Heme oxygenase 2 n=1 Tax=Saccharum hybrid cultivar SP80-3280 TaxID=193079 RepID=A0A2R4QNS6_9POAL|nr:heme oxygenase 2 [Saccharum hybrid cultivar SP80-3280]
MPLIAAASAVAPPPPRRVAPLRSLCTRRPGILALTATSCSPSPPPPVVAAEAPAPPQEAKPKPRRYPKQYPGESVGVAEEMRFVAMRLRNPKRTTIKDKAGTADADAGAGASENEDEEDGGGGGMKEEHEKEEEGELEAGEWMPSMEGFVRYLVDSKLVFGTIERVVAESTDVAYVYFRKSGLERSASISKDLEWFRKQGIAIPEPSTSGSTYAAYLTELAERNAPAFLSHYYNIYFAHITGGVAIGNKICKKILEGRELEFYKWDTDVELLLKDAREKLNELSKHWTRKDRNLCLKEAAKCFQYLGKMVRLIIL